MLFIGVDLGSTNIKATAYDEKFRFLGRESVPVTYVRSGPIVEFDAEAYYDALVGILARLLDQPGVGRDNVAQIVFTGQAESLVVLDGQGKALMRALSWMARMALSTSVVEAMVFSASLRTSSATTAKPRPASPARAASMAALRARRLV